MSALSAWLRDFVRSDRDGRRALVEQAGFLIDESSFDFVSTLKHEFDDDALEDLVTMIAQELVRRETALDLLARYEPLIAAYRRAMPQWLLRSVERIKRWALEALPGEVSDRASLQKPRSV